VTEGVGVKSVRLGTMFERKKVLGFVHEPMLSVYRERGVVLKDEALNPNRTAEDRSIYQLLEPGWLAVNRMKAWQGSLGISPLRGIISGHYICFRPRHAENDRYLHYLLRSPAYTSHFASISRGVRPGQIEIDNDELAATKVVLPPVEVQRRIADFLDDQVSRIDGICALRRRQRDLLESRRARSVGLKVAGVGDADVGKPSPLPWIERVGQDCESVRLARVLTLQRGVDLTADERREGSVPVVTTAGVSGWHDVAVAPGPGVVIGRYGTVGAVFFLEQDYWAHNTTLYVSDFRGNDPVWCYYLLRAFPYDVLQARAAVPGVNRNDMAVEDVPWIPLNQQRKAAARLRELDADHAAIVTALDQSIEKMAEYKQSLITAAVTGEFDVAAASSRSTPR